MASINILTFSRKKNRYFLLTIYPAQLKSPSHGAAAMCSLKGT